MTTEQNQPQAQPPQGQAPQGQPQGHRRRRRKRKGAKGQPNGAQANGQAGQNQQQQGQKPRHAGQNRNFQKNGNGNGGPGGGRRKNKPRRQQVFVGPMDHSYRVANGNIADAPPSTIEYRNGNGHPNHPVEAMAEAPMPVREDAPTRIFCFIDDLFFLAKIQETARKLGVKVGFVKADKDIVAKLADVPENSKPSLIVFDLNNANAKPLTLIPRIKSKLKRGTSVIGFLSHLQGDLKVKALEAGCDMVMPRSAFSQNLPNLLRRHGLDEELEAMEA
jgi:CheY-like chemotaxis protein